MVQYLFENNVFIYVMLGLCLLGICIKFLVYFTYKSLIKASDNMGKSKNRLMKILRLKFETCYKLKIGVNNVDAFVDKYVYKYKTAGVLLSTWENAGGQILITCLLTGTVGAVLGVVSDCDRLDILYTVFAGILTSGVLVAFENLLNLHTKRVVLRTDIRDYLENYLQGRLENEYFKPEMLEEYRKEYFDPEPNDNGVGEDMLELLESIEAVAAEQVRREDEKKNKKEKDFQMSKNDEKIIEDILKEYMA